MSGTLVVVEVTAKACRSSDGTLLPYEDAVDGLTQATWSSLRLPIDAIQVRVFRSQDVDANIMPALRVLPETLLERRFGAGPPGPVRPVSKRPTGQSLWLLVPVAYLVVGAAAVGFARQARRSMLVILPIRR
ncbi:hypothetical protein ACQPZA_24065 [Pseudonocardia xinjiangensis]|uniref:hypothetical protein n=1 Tax=Pseudonocardia xinjiangensis TaxID=75289 RepID=UPI003D8A7C4C